MKKSREFVLYNCFKEVYGYMQNEKVSSDTKNNKQENIIFGNTESVMGMHSEKISEFLTHSFILYHKIMQCWMQLEMINLCSQILVKMGYLCYSPILINLKLQDDR